MSPRFSIIPAGAVTDPRIEPRDLQVLCLLGRHIDDLGWCRRSQVRMAKELGCARSTVQGSLDRLIAAEWVQKRPEPRGPQGDTAHSYRVRLDHDESDSFYRDVAKIGRGRKRGSADGQMENAEETAAPPPPAYRSAPPVPPQERHPVPIYASAPVTTPVEREDSRESARARDESGASTRKWDFVEPDSTLTRATFDALCTAWTQGAIGGAGAIGDTTKAMAAIAVLDPDDHAMAIERAPRFLRSIKDAKRSYTMGIESYVHGRQFVHHPPPASASGGTIQPVELKPYVKELWAMYWKAIHRARQATGDDRHIRRLRDCTGWLVDGVTTGAVSLPSADDLASLVPIKIDGPEHLAWQDYTTRVGARLPKPDHVPVIYAPAAWPPPLTLAGSKPYRLALPVRIEVRSPAWWWRFFKSIEDGTPIVSTLAGRHRVDLLEPARRSAGAQEVDYGPIPLASELSAMVEVRTLTDAFEQWSTWISARGGDLAMWPHGSIWVPTEYPTMIFGQGKTEAGAAA